MSDKKASGNKIDISRNQGVVNVALGKKIKQTVEKIEQSNTASNELKSEVDKLSKQVETILPHLSGDEQKDASQAFETFATEVVREKPRRAWWSVSAEGLKTAAENINDISKPVIETVDRIISLINPFSI